MDQDLYELLQNADPDTVKQMIAALSSGEQIGMGQHLMQTPGAQGREVGRTYVASSPLEHAGVLAQRMAGSQMMGQGQQARGTGIQAYIDALRGKPKAPPQLGDNPMAAAQFANPYGSE